MGSLPPSPHIDVSRNHFAAFPSGCAACIRLLTEHHWPRLCTLLSPLVACSRRFPCWAFRARGHVGCRGQQGPDGGGTAAWADGAPLARLPEEARQRRVFEMVEALQEHPRDPNQVLIGYSRGLIIIWDLRASRVLCHFLSSQVGGARVVAAATGLPRTPWARRGRGVGGVWISGPSP